MLAVAYRWLEPREAYSRADEADLVLAGFVSFADPVLPDVGDVLAELKRDGVTVKILTGDNELVARHVCERVGLDDRADCDSATSSTRMDDAALGHVAEQASVFARVSPAQKNRIILALKRRGHVVGYHGRRHQRRALAARRRRRHFRDDRRSTSRATPPTSFCSKPSLRGAASAAFSKAAGRSAT